MQIINKKSEVGKKKYQYAINLRVKFTTPEEQKK